MNNRLTRLVTLSLLCILLPALFAQESSSSLPLPQTMRFCAFNCFNLQLNNGHYDAFTDDAAHKLTSTYTVIHFTESSVELNRKDVGGDTAVLTGMMAPDKQSITNGEIKWTKTGQRFPSQLTWGSSTSKAVKIIPPPPPAPLTRICEAVLQHEQQTQLEAPADARRVFALRELTGTHEPGHYYLAGLWIQRGCVGKGDDTRAAMYAILQDGDSVKMIVATPAMPITKQVIFDGVYGNDGKVSGKSGFNKSSGQDHIVLENDSLVIESPDTLRISNPNIELHRMSVPGINDALCDSQNSAHVLGIYALLRAAEAIEFKSDYTKAACWYEAGSASHDGTSEGLLALLYYQGRGVRKDYAKAFALASDSGSRDNAIGESDLALMYATGHGVAINKAYSEYWFEKARVQPMSAALSWTPKMLMSVTPDTPIEETGAIPRFMLPPNAAGIPVAPEIQGCEKDLTSNVTVDEGWHRSQLAFAVGHFPASACWAYRSATAGNKDAMRTMAWFYRAGIAVKQRELSATYWETKLANQGDLYSQARLAAMYRLDQLDPDAPAIATKYTALASKQPDGSQLVTLMINDGARAFNSFNIQAFNRNALTMIGTLLLGAFVGAQATEAEDYRACDAGDSGLRAQQSHQRNCLEQRQQDRDENAAAPQRDRQNSPQKANPSETLEQRELRIELEDILEAMHAAKQ